MSLLELIYPEHKIISIIGMAKNAGKTEVLNSLLDEIARKDLVPAVTSIGRDGEVNDIVTNTDKPEIYIETGTLVTTLERYIVQSDVEIEILEVMPYRSSLGKFIIGRAKSSGLIQLAGPPSTTKINDVSKKMLEYGADLVVVDGALSRVSSASPSISEGTILSTGAVVSRDLKTVVKKTYHQVHLFNLPEVKKMTLRKVMSEGMKNKNILLIDEQKKVTRLNIKTALNAHKNVIEKMDQSMHYIVLPGSLTGKMVQKVYAAGYKQVKYVVKDATKLFINEKDLNLFIKNGVEFYVMDGINLLAITINPYAPQGYGFDSKVFKETMECYFKDLPVVNVMEKRL